MDSFTITLPSNVKNDGNRIGDYRTYLPRRIDLSGDWEFCLKEISYTKSWYNIFEDQPIGITVIPNMSVTISDEITLQRGFYDKATLIHKINKGIEKAVTKTYENYGVSDEQVPPVVGYNAYTNTIEITSGSIVLLGQTKPLLPLFNSSLCNLLGICNENHGIDYKNHVVTAVNDTDGKIFGIQPVDITAGIHTLFVYCNIAEESIVGNSLTRLLKTVTVPPYESFGDQIVMTHDNPDYVKLSKKNFDMIHINIKDGTGLTVPFQFGRVICTLHFRRK